MSVHCLRIQNFEIPPAKKRNGSNKVVRKKIEDETFMRRTHYELKRSQHYLRRPPGSERQSHNGLRDSIIKLMEDNLKITAIGNRSSRLG